MREVDILLIRVLLRFLATIRFKSADRSKSKYMIIFGCR